MLANLALQEAEPEQRTEYLWPCNVQAWRCWCGVQTQWRVGGMGARTGLDYSGVRAYLSELGLCGDERRDVFSGICAAEQATLEVWSEQAAQEKSG